MAAAGSIAGIVIGSFVAAATLRWPEGRSIVAGRSHCDYCNTALAPRDLVPIVSFIMLRGRCRHCLRPIAPRHLAIEFVAGVIGGVSLWTAPGLAGAAGAVFGWLLLALLVLDVEHFWLPNRLTLPLAALGLVAGIWLPPALADRIIGGVAGFASLTIIAAAYKALTGRIGLGGGDPRLLGAIGAWLGWIALPFVLLLAAVLGLALVGYDRFSGQIVTRHSRVPLGALLAAAAWGLWLAGPLTAWQR